MSSILYDEEHGVAVVRLNRPERLNAWTREMETAYHDALARAVASREVRAIVVTAAGGSFSAGADLDEIRHYATDGGVPPRTRPVSFPRSLPKPIIAAVRGHCLGIGLVHALMCDLRFVAPSVSFRAAFAQRGLVAEHGSAWLLSQLIGPSAALDVLISGRSVGATEAVDRGLANRLTADDELEDAAIEYARGLSRRSSPYAMAAMKAQVYEDLERSLADAVADAERRNDQALAHPDFAASMAATRDTPPDFLPLQVRDGLVHGHWTLQPEEQHQ